VIAFGAADSIRSRFEQTALVDHITQWDESRVTDSDDEILVSHDWDEIRRFMWDFVGIVRTSKRLQRARSRISVIREEVRDYYIKHRVTNDNLELRNLALVAELIINSALQRQESRGLHFTLDFPDTLAHAKDTILSPETHQPSGIT
jgi:L-aspartate oxidase